MEKSFFKELPIGLPARCAGDSGEATSDRAERNCPFGSVSHGADELAEHAGYAYAAGFGQLFGLFNDIGLGGEGEFFHGISRTYYSDYMMRVPHARGNIIMLAELKGQGGNGRGGHH